MRVAEALAERATLQQRAVDLRERITRTARVQEGEQPAEDPQHLLVELDRVMRRHTTLVQAINRTNAATAFDESRTITDAIAERDEAQQRRRTYADLAQATIGANYAMRSTMSEIRTVPTIDAGFMQQRADEWAKRYRELDLKLQELNWQTELLE